MREYYSVLGVSKNAAEAEIINAYRKLAARLHPDANGSDPFFVERYRELQEAFNTLINPIKRAVYDSTLDPKFGEPLILVKDKEKPIVTIFEASKKAISDGEPITLRWQTIHASEVSIDFIGKVETEGTKIIRLPFDDKEFLKITINATNSFLNESVSRIIEIKNKDFNEKQHSLQQQQISEIIVKTSNTEKSNETDAKGLKIESKPKKESIKKEKKEIVKKESIVLQKKERALTKEERLAGLKVAYEDESQMKSFRLRDLYIYIVLIVLLVFVAIMVIFAYNLNPIL